MNARQDIEERGSELLRHMEDGVRGLRAQGAEYAADAIEEVMCWIDKYGEPEDWAKRAQAAHNRAENLQAAQLVLAQHLRVIRDTTGDSFASREADHALKMVGIPDPIENHL